MKILAMVLALLGVAHAQSKLKPGRYELTMKMEMEGLPAQHQLPSSTMHKCMSAEDVKDPMELAKKNNRSQSECEIKSIKREGNKVTWSVDCGPRGKGTGTIVTASESFELVSQLSMNDPQGTVRKMKTVVDAKRTGECAPGDR